MCSDELIEIRAHLCSSAARNGDANQSYQEIDFAFYLGMNGYLFIYESGTNVNWPGFYATGDTLRISVESGVVKYRKNGTVVYTSTATPTYPLLVDTSLYTANCTINNVVISGNLASGGSGSNVQWLVSDHLGTPRMIIDQTGRLANVKRHDYLPFGKELFAPAAGRSAAQGYSTGDAVRQQFTSKERDIETGLDYFGARYYTSVQGRFTGADPYDINFERQETEDPKEANALFTGYIGQPQHWNHYSYALNNPLKYVDPDGLYEYETELLGKKIKVHIDDSILKKDSGALKRIQDNLQKAIDKINAGADKLTKEQIQSIGSLTRISVSNHHFLGMNGSTFQITQRTAENPNLDKLSADIIHDSRHAEQSRRGLSYNEKTAIPMEMEASQFAVDVIKSAGGWDAKVLKGYEDDARTGHLPSGWKDKSTPKSRARVFDRMKKPRN